MATYDDTKVQDVFEKEELKSQGKAQGKGRSKSKMEQAASETSQQETAAAGSTYSGTRFSKLCDELIHVVPASRIGPLCEAVATATGEPFGGSAMPNAATRQRYLAHELMAHPVTVLPCWKKKDLRHFLRHLDAPESGTHAALAARALECMLGEEEGQGEVHRMMKRHRKVKSSHLHPTAPLGTRNLESLFVSVAHDLGLPTDHLTLIGMGYEAYYEKLAAKNNKDTVAAAAGARMRARKLHTVLDHVSSAARDAAKALARVESLQSSLTGPALQAVGAALGLGTEAGEAAQAECLDPALSSCRKLASATLAARDALHDALSTANKTGMTDHSGGISHGRGGITRAQVLADALYDKLHAIEGRDASEAGSECEDEGEGEGDKAAGSKRKRMEAVQRDQVNPAARERLREVISSMGTS